MLDAVNLAKKLVQINHQKAIIKVQWILDIINEKMLEREHHYVELDYNEVYNKAKLLGYDEYKFKDLIDLTRDIGGYEIYIITRYNASTEHLITVQIPDEIMEEQKRKGP